MHNIIIFIYKNMNISYIYIVTYAYTVWHNEDFTAIKKNIYISKKHA